MDNKPHSCILSAPDPSTYTLFGSVYTDHFKHAFQGSVIFRKGQNHRDGFKYTVPPIICLFQS